MPAAVKTNAFLLSEATLMMAPFGSASVFELTPSAHSVGMVRNVQLSQESDQVELRKGIQQLLVDSKKSNVRTMLTAEVFEFSAQNMFYSLSMNKTAAAPKRGKLKTAVSGATATIVVNTDPMPGDSTSGITSATDIPSGATILLQVPGESNDYTLPVRVTAATTMTGGDFTVTAAIPAGMNFPVGTRVWVVNEVPLGSTADQDFFCVKISSTLSNNERPVNLVLPKVKISKGFQINFDEANYGSMPFEFMPYFLTASEVSGRLTEIGTSQMGTTYVG